MMELTHHASVRQRQRSVPKLIIDWLLQYGGRKYDHHGGEIRYFDRRSIKKLEREFGYGAVSRLGDYFNAYLVASLDGQVITVGYRR